MKFNRLCTLSLILILLALSACQPSARTPAASTNGLPLPKTVKEAVLANFRPLTTSGRALGAAWSPDGQNLAYTLLSFAPRAASYHTENGQPKTEAWVAPASGRDGQLLDIGAALFYSKDGSEIYYQIYDPATGKPSVYAINPETRKTRHFLGTEGFPGVTALADGRLVLSEVGTHGPLRFFNPANGERQASMAEHPSIDPQNARFSPDGKLLAYPKDLAVYLSKPNGSAPKALFNGGSGNAKVWWSPNSQYLTYTTGAAWNDQLALADRSGKMKAILFPNQATSGTVSSVDWSPDSRWMLVSTEAPNQNGQPSRIFLFDTQGESQLLLESSYISASPAWSPDGRTLALSLWVSPDSDEPVFDIWLADLTDAATAANLPKSSPPAPKPTPAPLEISPDLPADQIVHHFWEQINQKEYLAAWSMYSKEGRIAQKFADFRAFYECFQQASLTDLQETQGDENTRIFSTKLDFTKDPACNELWSQPNDFYTILIKNAATDPWQIECFSNTTSCINQAK